MWEKFLWGHFISFSFSGPKSIEPFLVILQLSSFDLKPKGELWWKQITTTPIYRQSLRSIPTKRKVCKPKKFFNHLSPKKVWKIKGLIIACPTAYFLYITYLTHFSYVFLAILILIGTIKLRCRLFGGKAKGIRLESGIFMVTSLLQGLQISLWKIPDNWDNAQILCFHSGLFLYLMARTGQSRQKRLGFMVWVTSSILAISSHWNISFWESWLYFIKRHLTKSLLKKSNVKTNSTSEWFSLVLSLPWYLLYLLLTSLARSCLLSLSYGNKSSRHLLPYLISISISKTVDYLYLV